MTTQLATPFDWEHPQYEPIWKQRIARLAKLASDLDALEIAKRNYRKNPVDFIQDWGVTVDPRNAGTDIPVVMPFILFPRQRDYLEWLTTRWRAQEDGIMVKSRDCGASWLAMGFSVTLCLFWDEVSIGFGSATEDKVDRSGDPDSLFYKGRMFARYAPKIFKGAWDERKNSAHKRMTFPDTGSSVTGECGDNIGRGGRKTIYFVDEFAHVEHPKLVDASLIANTECRIEMSSVQGTANVFAERARGGLIERFDFHYRDDPRKVNPATGELRPKFVEKKTKTDPVIWAAEFECDFLASVEGIIIPQEWVQAAIGAHEKLGIAPTGVKRGAFDIADQGKDKNCYGNRHGILLKFIKSWSGKGSDIFESVERAYRFADEHGDDGFDYDGDGMGAGVRGDARKVQEERDAANAKCAGTFRPLRIQQFRGSGKVLDPTRLAPGTDRKNEDFFENQKAQSWWALRCRFLATFRAVNGIDADYNPSDLISIARDLPELTRTCSELSQPVWTWSKTGKMVIDKVPDDVASPNNADTVMMLYSYSRPPISINPSTMEMYVHATGTQQEQNSSFD